jgi:hypothetical protein
MSREHHQGCIPSRIMSPWLSSSFAMNSRFAFSPIGPRASLTIFAALFSLSVWFIRRDPVLSYMSTAAWIVAGVTFPCSVGNAIALLLKRFPGLCLLASHRVGIATSMACLLALSLIFVGLWRSPRADLTDVIYLIIVMLGILTLIAAITCKGAIRVLRGKAKGDDMLFWISGSIGVSVLMFVIPPFGLLLPISVLALFYGVGGYFAASISLSNINCEPDGAANQSQPVGPAINQTSPAAGSGG